MSCTKSIVGGSCVYILNCYIEPGDDERVYKRAARISEIVTDTLKFDRKAQIVICVDFNKLLPGISKAL
jgi:hypothetical protein